MYLWFLPCSQPAPGPGHHLCAGLRRDRRCSGKAGAAPEWKRVIPQPRLPGQGESGPQSPRSRPENPRTPALNTERAAQTHERGGRRRGFDHGPCSRTRETVRGLRAQGKRRAGGGTEGYVLFQLCSRFLGETLTLKLCANGEVTSVSRQGDDGEEGKSWGKRVPHFSAQRSLLQPPPWERPASGLRLPCHLPVPPLVLASLAGHLHRQKSRGRRRKDGGARPAAALPAESGGRQRQDTEGKVGMWRSGSPRGVGWALFLLLSLPRGGSLADFLDQLLIGQAVEAVDGQVRDEVLTGFAGDLFATSQVD